MIGSTKSQDEFPRILDLALNHQMRIFLLEVIRADQGGFVTHVLMALLVFGGELDLDFMFDDFSVAWGNRVPEFGFSFM